MKKIDVLCEQGDYPIIISKDYSNLVDYFFEKEIKYVIITDSNVAKFHLQDLIDFLKSNNRIVSYYIFEAGEPSKNLDTVKDIYSYLISEGITREDCVIALGGGVVGDTAGFVAASFLRGIRFIQIPTTLLAQIDSSIGGKTAVNLENIKNVVGAFYQPNRVYINFSLLKTLPKQELLNGLVEVLVHAIIRDKELFSYIEQNIDNIFTLDQECLEKLIYINCRIKASIIKEDVKESGIRRILNFGHTFGHAIEGSCNFIYKHGECVIHGIMGACYISEEMGLLSKNVTQRIKKLLLHFFSFVDIHNKKWEEIYYFMLHDKKINDETICFILIRNIGDVVIHKIYDVEIIERAYTRMLNENHN